MILSDAQLYHRRVVLTRVQCLDITETFLRPSVSVWMLEADTCPPFPPGVSTSDVRVIHRKLRFMQPKHSLVRCVDGREQCFGGC